MSLKIKHINPDKSSGFVRGTIAVNIPSKEQLLDMFLNHHQSTYLKVSAAYLHSKEQFNKRIGKDRAESYALSEESKFCHLKSIESRNGRWVFVFTTIVPDNRPNSPNVIGVEFGVAMSLESPNTRLEYATFLE